MPTKNDSQDKLRRKAEKVGQAKLNLIKARLALLQSYREEDQKEQNMQLVEKLKKEMLKWESMNFETLSNEMQAN